jgi:hypothetical protein
MSTLVLALLCTPSACKKKSPSEVITVRDPWMAQADATVLLGSLAMCSGQATPSYSGGDGCKKDVDSISGGYTCWTTDNLVAICPPDAEHPCKRVWRAPAEKPAVTP